MPLQFIGFFMLVWWFHPLVNQFHFTWPHHAKVLFHCFFIEDIVHIITTTNHFIEPCVCAGLEECCISTAVGALAIQAKEQVHISGCIPESERTRWTSDFIHAHHISCHCDAVCHPICRCWCIHTPLLMLFLIVVFTLIFNSGSTQKNPQAMPFAAETLPLLALFMMSSDTESVFDQEKE